MIFNMGGGAPAMNFKIIINPKPETAAENTIWVDTDVPVTEWVFSVTEPEAPVEGMLWVANGTKSQVMFNALKKGTLLVYPYDCKQYVLGKWEQKDAESYIGGEWKEWGRWLIKAGLTTHEIKTAKKAVAQSYSPMTSLTVSQGDGFINIKGSSGDGMVYIEGIDLTNYKKLTIAGTFTQIGADTANNLSVWTSLGTYITNNRAANTKMTATGATLDIEGLSGEHLVGVSMDFESSSTWKIEDLYFE